jgi:hypothetical protein
LQHRQYHFDVVLLAQNIIKIKLKYKNDKKKESCGNVELGSDHGFNVKTLCAKGRMLQISITGLWSLFRAKFSEY